MQLKGMRRMRFEPSTGAKDEDTQLRCVGRLDQSVHFVLLLRSQRANHAKQSRVGKTCESQLIDRTHFENDYPTSVTQGPRGICPFSLVRFVSES